jgi:hypothetical protein
MVPSLIFLTSIASPVLALAYSPTPYRPRRHISRPTAGSRKSPIYGVNSDPSDFLNNNLTVKDPFDEFYNATTLQTLTSKDINQVRVLGFNVSTTPASSEPSFDAWNALTSRGGVDAGSFGVDHAPYGNVGGRDVWGLSVPRSGPIDHFLLS